MIPLSVPSETVMLSRVSKRTSRIPANAKGMLSNSQKFEQE